MQLNDLPDGVTELQLLVLDLREALSERDGFIKIQAAQVENLRYHLHKSREAAYQICYATAGVLPDGYGAEKEPTTKGKRRAK